MGMQAGSTIHGANNRTRLFEDLRGTLAEANGEHPPEIPATDKSPVPKPELRKWFNSVDQHMEAILNEVAEIYYEKTFLCSEEATTLFNTLLASCAWERRQTSFASTVPRDEAYYGDPGTDYTYSRREYKPLPWIPELRALKSRVEQVTPLAAYTKLKLAKLGYNAALCNLYRDGNDSVGLHADAEPEMGPVIASVSLGAERLFRLKARNGAVAFAERLPHGSLLIMAGYTQKNCKHEVPKEPDVVQARINLTFRHIEHK